MVLKATNIIPTINEFVVDYLKSYMESIEDEEAKKLLRKVSKRFRKDDVQEALTIKINKAMKKKKKKNKDPNKPKRNLSPYILFCTANREEFKKSNTSLDSKQITQLLAKTWHSVKLTSEANKYFDLAKEDKKRYEREMKSYVPGNKTTEESETIEVEVPTKTENKKTKTTKKVKKPKSAYQLFMIDSREYVKESHPDFAFGEIQKEISRMWSELKEKKKTGDEEAIALFTKYQDMAAKCKNEYYRKLEEEGEIIDNRIIEEDPITVTLPPVEDILAVETKPKQTKKLPKKKKKVPKKVVEMDPEELIDELFED